MAQVREEFWLADVASNVPGPVKQMCREQKGGTDVDENIGTAEE